jgi:hypothetical protein
MNQRASEVRTGSQHAVQRLQYPENPFIVPERTVWRDSPSLFVLQTVSTMTSAAALSIEEKLVLAQLVYVHGDADWTTITSTWMTHHAVKNKDVNDPQVSTGLSRARKLRPGD